MQPKIDTLFDEAENRYLKPEELGVISQFVESLPERMETYRIVRDRELEIMQPVADQLQAQLPQENVQLLERSIKNALLTLRYCAMGMLMNDETLLKERLLNWLGQSLEVYDTRAVDTVVFRLLGQRLSQVLTPKQLSLLNPMLTLAQTTLLKQEPSVAGF